jgi:hypothetical protein
MGKQAENSISSQPKMVRLDADVHAWLVLLSERYNTTLSGAIRKLVTEHEPIIIETQNQIDEIKRTRLGQS